MGHKTCTTCLVEREETEFELVKAKYRRNVCRCCRNEREAKAYAALPQTIRKQQNKRQYDKKDKAELRVAWRKRERTPEYKAQQKEYQKRWVQENKTKLRARNAERRAREKNAVPIWQAKEELQEIYEKAKKYKEDTGQAAHVDHLVPLNSELVCGLHCAANMRIVHGDFNVRKHNKTWPDMP